MIRTIEEFEHSFCTLSDVDLKLADGVDAKEVMRDALVKLIDRRLECFTIAPVISHKNGPTTITLIPKSSNCNRFVRIHYWDKPLIHTDIHDHRWNFLSWVIEGKITEVFWEASACGNKYKKYEVTTNREGIKFHESGELILSEIKSIDWLRGTARLTMAKELHSISASNAITLLAEGKRVSDNTLAFVRSEVDLWVAGRKMYTPEDAFRLSIKLLAVIDN